MPEANVLYSVTAVVVVGLVAWVAFVLKTAKEPWSRPGVPQPRIEDVPVEDEPAKSDEPAEAKSDEPAEAKSDEPAEAKADEPAEAKADEPAEAKADKPSA